MLLCLGVLVAFLAASYARGHDSYVRVDDHLDLAVPLYKLLASSQPVFGGLGDRVEAIFDGIPRSALPSTLQLGVLLYYVLDPFWAHVANEALMRLVAFTGLLLLLRRHLLPEASARVTCGASLCFALLPFLPIAYASVAGQPLLWHAVLNLRARRASLLDWGILVFFPLYSSLVFIGFFVLLLLGLLVLHDLLRARRLDGGLLAATALVAGLYLASEYRLLHQTFFDDDYVSFRAEFVRAHGALRHSLAAALEAFFLNHRHATGLQSPFLLGAVAAALTLGARSGGAAALRPAALARALERAAARRGSRWDGLLLLTALCAALALFVGVWEWTPVQELVEAAPRPVRMYNFHRLQWLQTPLFALAFGFALHALEGGLGRGRAVVLALVLAQGAWAVWNSNGLAEQRKSGLSFREYYSPPLFAEIREQIGRPAEDYRVVSFGLTPSIAFYNGFYVLDGSLQDYPLTYKHRFRRVIAPELEKDDRLRRWYDLWGGHVNLMSSELGMVSGYGRRVYTKHAAVHAVERLDIDTQALRELGADYVLSAVEIRNHAGLGLRLERIFERSDSPWRIHLYALERS